MRVLVVDDDPISLRLIQANLETWGGYEVTTARDGGEAWERMQSEAFPLLITDWLMPELNGVDLVRRVRAAGRAEYTYIILQTAKSEMTDLVEGMEAGADDFLSKPIDLSELRVRVRAGERIVRLERELSDKNARLNAANQRMRADLEAASRLQQSLLPPPVLNFGGVRFEWAYRPCEELAGDTLNVFPIDDDRVVLYALDVCGHGIPAALLSVTLSRILAPGAEAGPSSRGPFEAVTHLARPEAVAADLNRQFSIHSAQRQFFTLWYGVLNLKTLELTMTGAGHPGPFLLRAEDVVETVAPLDPPVGIHREFDFTPQTIRLRPDDRMFIYSDGIPDAFNADREQFGVSRLLETFRETRRRSLSDALEDMIDRVTEWCRPGMPQDDISCLALEVGG
ncbi:PP2C family protein-serine/threonine phosphatase [Maioricimonas rarisocia]|nr:SpoIIE family protein phosphatase [Maioricimonas rarisocia]